MKISAISMEKPTIITDVPCQSEEKGDEKKSNTVKYVVLGIAAVCITVAVVAGFVFAFKFHTESTNEIVRRTLEVAGVKEEIEDDKTDNTRLYTVNADGETQYIMYDFNKKLRLVKIRNYCFVNAMNGTQAEIEESNGEDDSDYVYTANGRPISDKSFLAKRGQDLCNGLDLYWTFPECDQTGVTQLTPKDTAREKRQLSPGDGRVVVCYVTPYIVDQYCCLRVGLCGNLQVCAVYPCVAVFIGHRISNDGSQVRCNWFRICPPARFVGTTTTTTTATTAAVH